MKSKVAILGGGMLGLTTALRLAQRGHAVTVIEAQPEIGGLTAGFAHDDVRWDRFYHVIEQSDADLLALLDELGLAGTVQWVTTNTNYFDSNGLYPLNNALDYLKLPALPLHAKCRVAVNILYANAIDRSDRLESESARDWLLRWSGRAAFDALWTPLLRGKLGANLEYVSAAYIHGVMRRFYGARQGAQRTECFGYSTAGYNGILERLETSLKQANVRILTGAPVATLESCAQGLRVDSAHGSETFDKVVATIPANVLAAMCPSLPWRESQQHRMLRYQGVICPSLLLRRGLGGAYMTYITDQSIPFTTIIEMSALTGTARNRGHHLAYLPRYVPADSDAFEQSDEDLLATSLDGLKRMFPDFAREDVVTARVARARHVVALPTMHYSTFLPPLRSAVPGLFVVNSTQIVHASLSVTESVALANRFAAGFDHD